MQQHCHRCGGELAHGNDVTPFCPHCGAPQLYLPDYESAATIAGSVSTEAQQTLHPQLIDWQTAIRCAALVTAVAVIFSLVSLGLPYISLLCICWILSASMTTLALYQRRRPVARMDAAIGARIGLTTGLLLVAGLGIALAIAGLIARFGLHSMSQFDAETAVRWAAARATLAASNAQSSQMLSFFDLPEFRAGLMLAGISVYAAIILFLSTLGGALAGLLRTRHAPAA
jgi:hypothetical protein